MKAKLIKDHADYHLVDDKRFIIGTTDKVMLSCTDKQKLSLKNCQAIERGYDLDELAEEEFPILGGLLMGIKLNQLHSRKDFKAGFQKALELMGGKKFTEEDIHEAYFLGERDDRGGLHDILKSQEQHEWDVEIEIDAIPADRAPGGWDRFPKLDADGCLILKPLPKE